MMTRKRYQRSEPVAPSAAGSLVSAAESPRARIFDQEVYDEYENALMANIQECTENTVDLDQPTENMEATTDEEVLRKDKLCSPINIHRNGGHPS